MLKENIYLVDYFCDETLEDIEVCCESFSKAEELIYNMHDSTGLDIQIRQITLINEDE